MSNEIFSSFGSINDYKNAKKIYNLNKLALRRQKVKFTGAQIVIW